MLTLTWGVNILFEKLMLQTLFPNYDSQVEDFMQSLFSFYYL